MQPSDNQKDIISAVPYFAFVAALVGGNLLVTNLSRNERHAEHTRITELVGDRNITADGIAEQFAYQLANVVVPTIKADTLYSGHDRLKVVYTKPEAHSQTKVPVIIHQPTSLVSGSYFHITNGLSVKTYHCASAHRINLSVSPYSNVYHIASLYTKCAEVSLAKTPVSKPAYDYVTQMPIELRDTVADTLSGHLIQPEKVLKISVGDKPAVFMADTSPLTPEQTRPYVLIGTTTFACALTYKASQLSVEGHGHYKDRNDRNPRPVISVYNCHAKLG